MPLPASHGGQAAHIQLFLRAAIGFAGTTLNRSDTASGPDHRLSKLRSTHLPTLRKSDALAPAASSLQRKQRNSYNKITLTQRGANAPPGHSWGIGFRGLVETADQYLENIVTFRMLVAALPIPGNTAPHHTRQFPGGHSIRDLIRELR